MRQLERRYASQLPPEYEGLMEVWRWASMGGRTPKIGPDHPAFFYALRGSPHEDRDLVNMLLTDLSRLDFRQLYICHKPLFYATYQSWPESKRAFVVKFLEEEYAIDKAGARETLFGREPSMAEQLGTKARPAKPTPRSQRVNPWADSKGWKTRNEDDDDEDEDDEDDWRHRSKQRRAYDRRQREKQREKERNKNRRR